VGRHLFGKRGAYGKFALLLTRPKPGGGKLDACLEKKRRKGGRQSTSTLTPGREKGKEDDVAGRQEKFRTFIGGRRKRRGEWRKGKVEAILLQRETSGGIKRLGNRRMLSFNSLYSRLLRDGALIRKQETGFGTGLEKKKAAQGGDEKHPPPSGRPR